MSICAAGQLGRGRQGWWRACAEQLSRNQGGEPKGEVRGAALTLNLLLALGRDSDTQAESKHGRKDESQLKDSGRCEGVGLGVWEPGAAASILIRGRGGRRGLPPSRPRPLPMPGPQTDTGTSRRDVGQWVGGPVGEEGALGEGVQPRGGPSPHTERTDRQTDRRASTYDHLSAVMGARWWGGGE